MNIRQATRCLSNDDVKAILWAWQWARTIRLPLNVLITVRPYNMDAMNPADRCAEVQRVRNNYGEYARRHNFVAAAIHTREIEPDNTGEHFHLLCHVPLRLRRQFMANAERWRAFPGEVDTRPANYIEKWTRTGKVRSIGHYIVKQMEARAFWQRPYSWQRGGTIIGQRWGCTRNLLQEKDSDGRAWIESAQRIGAGSMIVSSSQSFERTHGNGQDYP